MVFSAQTWFKFCVFSTTPRWSLFCSVFISKVRVAPRPAGSAFLSDWYVWVTLLSLSLSLSLFWASSVEGKWMERIMEGGKRQGEGGREGGREGREGGREGGSEGGREGGSGGSVGGREGAREGGRGGVGK